MDDLVTGIDDSAGRLEVALASLASWYPMERGTVRLAVTGGAESPSLAYRSDCAVVTLQVESADIVWLECSFADEVFRDEIDLRLTHPEILVELCVELLAGRGLLVRGILSKRPVGLRVRTGQIDWYLPRVD